MAIAAESAATARASGSTRWGQLVFGIICMVMIANLQYGWTLFVNPIDQKYHWGRAAIQVAFTIFVLTETWLVPFEGYLIDKFGPRVMICGSGVLVAIAWVINSMAELAVPALRRGGDRRHWRRRDLWRLGRQRAEMVSRIGGGLLRALTAAGFGAGSALTIIPIANMIQTQRLPIDLPMVRARARYRRVSGCAAAEGSGARRSPGSGYLGGATDAA